MKTTVDISDSILREVKAMARREQTTVRALIEEGLRLALRGRRGSRRGFALRDASFKGRGLQPGVDLTDGEQIRGLTYQGRGG